MYLLIIILPLLGSILSGFFGRKIGVSGSQIITTTLVILTTLLAIIAYIEVGLNNIPVSIQLFRWVDSESLNIYWAFHFDALTVSMLLPVLVVSSLVHLYSIGYMEKDPHIQRFFSYLSLFTFMMVVLVTADNYLLVGVCSYLLVNFWYTRIAANQSSISALLTNRVGDCFLTIGMFALLLVFGNLDYATVFSLGPYISENVVTLICICLLIGAMAKSSQLGLHVWLPMAFVNAEGCFSIDLKKSLAYKSGYQVEGPTPVSALIHAATIYKALLFLGAGSVIHAMADNQDFRKYGGLRAILPLTYSVMVIASLSLVAFPFLTGFYSKDLILELSYGQYYFSSTAVYFIAIIGATFTTAYSVKVLYLTFLTSPNGPLISYKNAHEGDLYLCIPLIVLALFSIFFGYIAKDIYVGLGSNFFADNSLFIHPSHEIAIDAEFSISTYYKLLPFACTIICTLLAVIISEFSPLLLMDFKYSRLGYNTFVLFNQRFFVELFYNKYISGTVLTLAGKTTKLLDRGSLELIGPYGLENGLLYLGKNISSLDTGVITSYALYILIGLTFYISIPYIYSFDNSLILVMLYSLFTLTELKPSRA
uniref:NADH-ubiquinone oxidoreductase chain 5 n=1 Tax=Orbilia brochopaga TaxID=3140254 RepID=A0A4Y5MZC0_9PEZI|nr:NADH dehydrogenase subunit 5 [Drechslerella brochopaga]